MPAGQIAKRFDNDQSRATIRCAIALSLVIVVGTFGFCLIETDWGVWRSLFFTLITITTVGYGAEGLSANGEKFAAVLLLFGIGTATYTLNTFAQVATDYRRAWRRKMQQQIDRLNGHFLVCGFGRMGMTICEELQEAGLPILIVEDDSDTYKKALELGHLAIHGNADDDRVLEAAGAARARGVVCATESDAENVFITLSIRDVNPNAFIACRASCDRAARRMRDAGASVVVSPYTTAGMNIVDAILRPKSAEVLQKIRHNKGNFVLSEVTVANESPLNGMSIREMGESFPDVAFIAIERQDVAVLIRPGGCKSIQGGDVITVAGRPDELEHFIQRGEKIERDVTSMLDLPSAEPQIAEMQAS